MSYYIAATLQAPFEEAIKQTEAALKEEGFGVISRIDIQEALKTKIGVDFRPYTILGACNPALAHEALKLEDKVGTMLPCNVVVQAQEDGSSEVAAIDPVASMQAIENPQLLEAASEVRQRLARVIQRLETQAAPA
jgi:uncharacterized protein (DUF302 family)